MKKVLLLLAVLFSCMVPRYYLLPYTGVYIFHMRTSAFFYILIASIAYSVYVRNVKVTKRQLEDIGVFLLWLFVAIVLMTKSEDTANSICEVYYLLLGLLSVTAMNLLIRDMDSIRVCFAAILCGLLIHLAIGYYEVITKTHFFAVGINDTIRPGKPVSIFYNNNDFGTFCAVMIPLAMGYINMGKTSIVSKVLSVLLLLMGSVIILYAQSDTIQVAVALVGFGMIAVKLSEKLNKGLRTLIVVGTVLLAGVLSFATSDLISNLISQFLFSEQARLNLIKNGFVFLRESRGMGIGYGNTQYYLQFKSVYNVFNIFYFHNWYFEILFCGGVIAFLLYLCFHFGIIIRLFRMSKKSKDANCRRYDYLNVRIYVLVSFLVFSAVCISSSSNLYSEWMWMYYGLISAYVNLLCRKGDKEASKHE